MKKRHKIESPLEESSNFEIMESSSSSSSSSLDDDFCRPCDCPERLDTMTYPSETSCMPEGRLQELEEKIDAANRMLLDLGLSNEQSELGRRILFDGLAGELVKVKINISDHDGVPVAFPVEEIKEVINNKSGRKKTSKKKRLIKKRTKIRAHKCRKKRKSFVEGYVRLIGQDFVHIQKQGRTLLLPFSRIDFVMAKKPFVPPPNIEPLADIDPCFRRELTFHFGETVANDPDLIQIFFRIKLSMYLKAFAEEKLTIHTKSGKERGILRSSDNEKVILVIDDGEAKDFPLSSIFYVEKS